MKLGVPINIKINNRLYDFTKQHAIRDVYDALVELITNSDDSYHRLHKKQNQREDGGPILIAICEQRKGNSSYFTIYDKAEGMTLDTMKEKFAEVGVKKSEEGDRGFMGRGAKDCTVLGKMVIESIKDNKYYKCELTTSNQFVPLINGNTATEEIRKRLHIERGNGTAITIEMLPNHPMPRIENIIRDLPWHYALRDMLSKDSPTKLNIINLNKPKSKPVRILHLRPDAELVFEGNYTVQGYPDAKAKLIIWRTNDFLEDPVERFRRSGLIVKSKRAIHGCGFLHPGLEKDPFSKRYFGRIECDYIDTLLNEYDNRRERKENHPAENPSLLIDPNRQTGLRSDHPFSIALYQHPTDILKSLIEKDKEKERGEGKEIANSETQSRLNELAKAASKYLMQQVEDYDELSVDEAADNNLLVKKGVFLYPSYFNIAIGQVRTVTLYVNKNIYDREGQQVNITCSNNSLIILDPQIHLKQHSKRSDRLTSVFRVKGDKIDTNVKIVAKATGMPDVCSFVKVVETPISEHYFNNDFEFEHKHYQIKEGSTKNIKLYAKYPELVTSDTTVKIVSSDNESLPIKGKFVLSPIEGTNYALCEVQIQGRRLKDRSIEVEASFNGLTTTTKVKICQQEEKGPQIEIKLVPEDLGVYRATWATLEGKPNLLKISAKHESIKRYLGPPPDFIGQDKPEFRILLAELVAERICNKALEMEVNLRPYDFKDEFAGSPSSIVQSVVSQLQNRIKSFVAIAHKIMVG